MASPWMHIVIASALTYLGLYLDLYLDLYQKPQHSSLYLEPHSSLYRTLLTLTTVNLPNSSLIAATHLGRDGVQRFALIWTDPCNVTLNLTLTLILFLPLTLTLILSLPLTLTLILSLPLTLILAMTLTLGISSARMVNRLQP